MENLTLSVVENNDIIISCSPLFLNPDQEFYNAAKITDLLYRRLHWKRLVYLIMREASNFYYSRLKICDSQVVAKSNMIYLIRESRNCGLSLALDSVRFYSARAIFSEGDNSEYTTRPAKTVKGARALLEAGFEYVTDMDGYKLFRKRK